MRTILAALVLFAVLPAAATAQCNPVPGTGCSPTALPVQCGGTGQIGTPMKFACLNNGRTNLQLLLAGGCVPPFPLPGAVACVTGPCSIGVGPQIIAIPMAAGGGSIGATVPNDPNLVGQSVCLQCADVILSSAGACVAPGGAVSITFF